MRRSRFTKRTHSAELNSGRASQTTRASPNNQTIEPATFREARGYKMPTAPLGAEAKRPIKFGMGCSTPGPSSSTRTAADRACW